VLINSLVITEKGERSDRARESEGRERGTSYYSERIVNLILPPISPTAVLEAQGERLLGLGKEELESCISW
jgi:hypothetical protein